MQFALSPSSRPRKPLLRRASPASAAARLRNRRRHFVTAASAKQPTPEDGSGSSSSDDARDALPSTSSSASTSASASASTSSSSPSPSPRRSSSTSTAPAPPPSSPAPAPTPSPPLPLRAELPTTLPALPFPSRDVLVPGQTKRLHLYEARYLALLDEALARRDGCFAHVVAEPVSSLRASRNYYDVTEEYTRFQSPRPSEDDDDDGFFSDENGSKKKKNKTRRRMFPPPPLVVGSYALRLATLARIVDIRRPPARSRAPGALVTIRGEARLALLSLEGDAPYLRCAVEGAADAVPTAEAVCGARGKEECEAIIVGEGEEGGAEEEVVVVDDDDDDDDDDEEEGALVAAVLSRGAQEVEALLWDVVNLSYKLPRNTSASSSGISSNSAGSSKNSDGDFLRISAGRRRFRLDDGGDETTDADDDEIDDEDEEPLLPDPTGTIASLQSALNWSADVPGLTALSLASEVDSSSSSSAAAPSLPPLAAAAERAARVGFAALQQVPHADSPESLEGLASVRNAAMETDDTAERLRLAADFLRGARAELAAKAALRALQLG